MGHRTRRFFLRPALGLLLGAGVLLVTALPALAAKPIGNCPNAASAFDLVDVDEWWARTITGFETEGIPVYVGGDPANGFTDDFDAIADAFGFADGQAFKDFIFGAQWDQIDTNGDDHVCMKPYPHTPGSPAYLFNGIDNLTAA